MMVFATDQPGHANCPDGVTGLGLAGSSDGRHWGVSPSALALPDPTSLLEDACRITEPSLMYDASTDSLHVWFTAEGPGNVLNGIGHLELQLDAAGDPIWPALHSGIVAPSTTHREPSVMRMGSTYIMMLADDPDIDITTGSTPSTFTTPDVALEVSNTQGAVPWIGDQFLRAAMNCRSVGVAPLQTHAASLDSTTGSWAIGVAVASPSTPWSWLVNTDPNLELSSLTGFGGFDVARSDSSGMVIYMGHNGRIKVASSVLPGAPLPAVMLKDCP